MATKHTTIIATLGRTKSQRQSEVTLHNCQCHTEEFGSVVVYKGTKEDCEKVANMLGSTGLKVSVVD